MIFETYKLEWVALKAMISTLFSNKDKEDKESSCLDRNHNS